MSSAPASFALLLVIGLVSVIAFSAPRLIERNLLRPYHVLRRRDFIPLVTCGFIHANWSHLIFNALTLYFFGPNLEATIGTPHFLALYFIGLVLSSAGTVWKHREDPNYASLGASGAILAVLFAYIVYYPTQILYLYFAIPIPAVLFAFGYLAYTIWASKNPHGGINHDAHLDGALTGLLFVALTDFGAWRRAFDQILG
ncbi:MAG: rhomboid family intramembrane serine protease [Steroidobacteraceae bacterium]|nr:rhomboid family intramembrane serine protease [Steroidobacteraceae bacterium]